MYAKLISRNGGKALIIEKDKKVIVGRETYENNCDFGVNDEYMSRQHAVFIYNRELCIQDLGSRNGSFINGRRINPNEIIPLSEGDVIRLGNAEFRVHFNIEENDTEMSWGFRYKLRNSVGGRKLQVETAERGCMEYQIRMIEENPELCIAEVIHVSNIDRDCFLCDLGSYLSLKDCVQDENFKINGAELLEKIVKAVKLGEEHMLERSKYIISPNTVFLNRENNLRLIYVPCIDKKEDNFSGEIKKLCDFLIGNCNDEFKDKLISLKADLKSESLSTVDLIKEIYRYKDYDIKNDKSIAKKNKMKKLDIKVEYIITVISFVVLMAVFWMGILSVSNMAALFLIIAGINLMMYGLSSDKKKGIEKFIGKNKLKKEKK